MCDYFKKQLCSSCNFNERENSLEYKASLIRESFSSIQIEYRGTDSKCFGFRNKAKLAVFSQEDKSIGLGITRRDLSQVDISSCPLYTDGIQQLVLSVKDFIVRSSLPIYDIKKRNGELKYIIIMGTADSSEHILRFVVKSKKNLPEIQNMVPALLKKNPTLKVVSVNIQPIPHAIVEGHEEIILTQDRFIKEQMCEYRLNIGPSCFFQTNPGVAGELYQTLQKWIKEQYISSALDMYCGVGCFSFFASKYLGNVTGVEISKESIECATLSAKENNVERVVFISEDALTFFKRMKKEFDAIIVNPPRKGLGKDFCQTLVERKTIKKLYYSSCNAKTLIEDYEILKERFTPSRIAVFDMFPFTSHYETLIEFL